PAAADAGRRGGPGDHHDWCNSADGDRGPGCNGGDAGSRRRARRIRGVWTPVEFTDWLACYRTCANVIGRLWTLGFRLLLKPRAQKPKAPLRLPNHAQQPRVAQLLVNRPLDEPHFHSNFRLNPVSANSRQPLAARERRRGDLELIEALAQIA